MERSISAVCMNILRTIGHSYKEDVHWLANNNPAKLRAVEGLMESLKEAQHNHAFIEAVISKELKG